jgi:hypothetical protein
VFTPLDLTKKRPTLDLTRTPDSRRDAGFSFPTSRNGGIAQVSTAALI